MSQSNRKVLVVDDNIVIRETLRIVLEKNEFEVWQAGSAEEGIKVVQSRGLPHLALVDFHLPKMNGFGFCKKVLSFSDMPIIMLSSEDDEEIVVTGLNKFAEDFIVKTDTESFRESELVSRINRVMNRLGDFPYELGPMIEAGNEFSVSFVRRKAVINEREISLTPIESKLLHVLMRNAGETVSYDYLIRRLWPTEMAFEDRLHTHVHRLRKKIEDVPRDPRYIKADWGNGYTFPLFSNS